MIKKFKIFLYEPKPKIGWVHSLTACFGAVLCAYLSMMVYSSFANKDYVYQILPSIILTPVLMSIYGLWFLFSNQFFILLKKIVYCSIFFLFLFILSIKVF